MEFLIPMTVCTCVAAFTPGPNNVMVAASGANFGYRRTLPHISGVVVGYAILLLSVAFGLGEVFRIHPQSHTVLRYAGAGYLAFLAYKIANAAAPDASGPATSGEPLTWLQAAVFQCVNVKAWTVAATLIATFAGPEHFARRVGIIFAVNVVVSLAAVSTWTVFGRWFSRYLSAPKHLRIFNYTMGGLLAATCVLLIQS